MRSDLFGRNGKKIINGDNWFEEPSSGQKVRCVLQGNPEGWTIRPSGLIYGVQGHSRDLPSEHLQALVRLSTFSARLASFDYKRKFIIVYRQHQQWEKTRQWRLWSAEWLGVFFLKVG